MAGLIDTIANDNTLDPQSDPQFKFLVLCGARWVGHRDFNAARELIATLESAGDAEVAFLAGTFLAEGSAWA